MNRWAPGDERTLVDLIVDQIEFADVVVLNRVGSATAQDRATARKIVRALNPDADLVEAVPELERGCGLGHLHGFGANSRC